VPSIDACSSAAATVSALVELAVDPLLLPLPVVADERGGGVDDATGASEVAAERDGPGPGVVAFELEDVREVRAAPAVDRLVGIAHREEVAAVAGDRVGDGELGLVRVLVLVDQQLLEAFPRRGADVLVALQEQRRAQQQIVEVERLRPRQRLLIGPPEPDERALPPIHRDLGELIHGLEGVLAIADRVQGLRRVPLAGGDLGLGDRPLHGLPLVGGVEDREVLREARGLGVLAQEAGREAVERGGDEAASARKIRRQQFLDAAPHLRGGLVGEGHREDRPRRHALRDQPRDAPGDDAGLARTGPRKHERRPFEVGRGVALRVGQSVEYRGFLHARSLSRRGSNSGARRDPAHDRSRARRDRSELPRGERDSRPPREPTRASGSFSTSREQPVRAAPTGGGNTEMGEVSTPPTRRRSRFGSGSPICPRTNEMTPDLVDWPVASTRSRGRMPMLTAIQARSEVTWGATWGVIWTVPGSSAWAPRWT
jgi:hypothetical protein